MKHDITIVQLGRHEHSPRCTCGWAGLTWRGTSGAEAEADGHLAEAAQQKEYAV